MGKSPKYDIVLFILLMILGFLPMLQGRFKPLPLKPLNGVVIAPEKPDFSLEAYLSGNFAKQAEAYASQHFGFREPIIRLYNQYLWDCFRKTYAQNVVAGKENWLFYSQSARDYYGQELLRWNPSVEVARGKFDQELKYLNWARSILKENGVELLVFMAPEKSFLYPEFLPDYEKDTTTFNACNYFAQRFEETGFPYIEMTRWFLQIKDTVDYPLIPQAGAHWIFPSVYAADSLLRLMEELKGITLPKIKIGEAYSTRDRDHDYDNDLELLLNLTFPLRHRYGYCPRHEVGVECDSTTVKPKVLFIGNSYFWAMNLFSPFPDMFEKTEFWYYFSKAYFGEGLTQTADVSQFDLVEKLLDFDYVIWFTTGNQMNKGTSDFAAKAILNLCYSKEDIDLSSLRIIDSLRHDSLTLTTLDKPLADSNYKQLLWPIANRLIYDHAACYFHELDSDSIPKVRNPRIREIMIINEIKKDSVWMWNLSSCQTVIQNATLEQVLLMEAHNVIDGKPLMRDMTNVEAKRERVEQFVADMVQELKGKPALMQQIEEKAMKYHRPVEEQTIHDACWIVNTKIKKGIIVL